MIKKKIKAFLKYFIPPILVPGHFREIFNNIIHKNKNIHHFEFENKFFTRHAFINKAISKFKDCKYLEIGVYNNEVFNSIPLKIENKFGVDPVRGGNFRMGSDDFFKKYSHLKFDVIFIDGLHEYEQCQKDLINSIKFLNNGGYIFLHDLIPLNWRMELVPRIQKKWNGDVWKVAYELHKSKNIKFKIADIDNGVGYFKKTNKIKYLYLNSSLKNKRFKDFIKIYKSLPIISGEKALKNIIND